MKCGLDALWGSVGVSIASRASALWGAGAAPPCRTPSAVLMGGLPRGARSHNSDCCGMCRLYPALIVADGVLSCVDAAVCCLFDVVLTFS